MTPSSGKKVLLIGWDAADWEMIDPLIQAGEMPALARLIREGVRGNIATLQPVLSPMLWTSIATGKRADKHGICGFTEPFEDATGIGPVRSTSRKCKAVWNLLSQSGLKSNIIGWFASHPAEPINGVMVSDQFFTLRGKPGAVEPPPKDSIYPPALVDLAAKLRVTVDDILAEDLLAFIPRLAEIDLKTDERPLKLARRLARSASVHNLATALIQSEPWNLMGVYYDAIDQFGHEFMPYHPPQMEGVSEADFAWYRDVMRGCYRFQDMMLHALLQYVDAETTVILVSDHGYECGRRRPSLEQGKKDPEGCHRPFGVVCLNGPGIRKNGHLYGASILDVTPTILTLLDLPLGMDMDGRPWLEALEAPRKPDRIFSWEEIGNDKAGLHAAHSRQDPAEAAQAIQQLVELGYIAAPGEDVLKTIRSTTRCNQTNLARALLGTPREAQAVPLLELLLAENPENDWCRLTLARCLIRAGKLAEARKLLESAAPAVRETGQVQLIFSDLAFAEGNAAAALEHVRAAERSPAAHPALSNQLGPAYVRLERWHEAALAFEKTLAADPDNAAAYGGLARVHLQRGEPEKVVEAALQAVGLIHYFPEAHYHLGRGLELLGKTREAAAAYETAMGIGYFPAELCERLAGLYRAMDPAKTAFYENKLKNLKKRRIYHADINTTFPNPGGS